MLIILYSELFTLLLGRVVKKFGGDVIKFCGDAILITWTVSTHASTHSKKECVLKATDCAMDLLRKGDHFSSDKMPNGVSLRLHCGISCGELHLMALGNADRMEFLVSGAQLRDLGEAEATADPGQLCMCHASYEFIKDIYTGAILPTGVKILDRRVLDSTSSPKEYCPCLPTFIRKRKSKKLSRVYLKQDSVDEITTIEPSDSNELKVVLQNFTLKESKKYKKALIAYVHETARKAILNRTSEHLAEIRQVVTIFIQIMNLDDDFDNGNHRKPQLAFLQVLDVMKRLQGTVRQFVVDDKGCVIICAFGLPGFSSFNDSIRAVSAALGIRNSLLELNITCRVGIAQGMAYCGYVGSKNRKEYCIVGASVNLAARLMAHGDVSSVLVDGSVFLGAQDDFTFDELPKVIAKGYDAPVQVFSPRGSAVDMNRSFEEVASRSSAMKDPVLLGRSAEVTILQRAVLEFSVYAPNAPLSGDNTKRILTDAKKVLLQDIDDEVKVVSSPSPLSSRGPFSYLKTETAENLCSRDSGDDDCPEDTRNKVLVVGCAGYGKTALITEIIRRNFLTMFTMARLTCHVANMFEPYEGLTQIFKALLMDTPSDISGVLSPKLKASFKCDSNLSLNDDEDNYEGESETLEHEEKSDAEKSNFESQIREEVYTTVFDLAMKHVPSFTVEIVDKRCRMRGESLLSTKHVTAGGVFDFDDFDEDWDNRQDDEGAIHSFEDDYSVSEFSSSPLPSECIVLLHRSDISEEKKKRNSVESTFYSLAQLLPLLRICFNANPECIADLQEVLEENSMLSEVVAVLASEVLRVMIPLTKSRTLVVEDLQWCDKPTFRVITKMLSHFPTGLFIGSMRPSEKGMALYSHKFARIASFEGSAGVNTIDELSQLCQVVSLEPFGRAEVKAAIRYVLGDKIVASDPNVVSESSIATILAKSEHGMVGKVFEQIRLLESDILTKKYGSAKLDNAVVGQQQFDRLDNECQVIVKMASVCGTSFTVAMLSHVLEKMGYVSIAAHVVSSLRQLEDKNIVKRVFGLNRAAQGDPLVKMTRSFSQRRIGILSNADKLVPSDDKLYTFLNKKFRESVYSIMLESQRAAVHAVIGAKLAKEYNETFSESSKKENTEMAEALAFHFSRANNLPNEIKYALETAKISKRSFMIATSYEYLLRVVLICTQQKPCQQLIEELYCTPSTAVRDSFAVPLTKRQDFGSALSSRMYLSSGALKGSVRSSCSLVTDLQLSEFVAELSILEYM